MKTSEKRFRAQKSGTRIVTNTASIKSAEECALECKKKHQIVLFKLFKVSLNEATSLRGYGFRSRSSNYEACNRVQVKLILFE